MPFKSRSRFTWFSGIAVCVICAGVLFGWIIDIPILTSIVPGYAYMKFNTALSMLICGISLLFLLQSNIFLKKTGKILSLVAAFIGLLTLLEKIIGTNLWSDRFFTGYVLRDGASYPGIMSSATALNILFAGFCLYMLYRQRLQQVVQLLVFLIIGVSVLALVSNDFNKDYLNNFPFFSSMSIHTAVVFILFGVGILLAPGIRTTRFPFEWKLIGGIGFILFTMIISFYMFNKNNSSFINSTEQVDHTREVLYEAERIQTVSRDMESGTRGFIITGDERFLELFYRGADSIYDDLASLKHLTLNNPIQQKRVDTLQQLITDHIAQEKQLIDLKRKNQSPEAEKILASGKGLEIMEAMRNINSSIEETEKQFLDTKKAATRQNTSNYVRSIFLFLLLVATMLIAIYLLVQDNLRARNKAEDELRESEEWFATTLSSIGDGVIVTDQYCRIIFMNPVARQLTKWGQEAYGKLIETVFDIVSEKNRKPIENPIRKALRDGQVIELTNHTILMRKDKSEIAINDSAAPIIDDQGQITGVVLVFRDVTEQRKSEAAVRYNALLLENMSDAVISLDEEYRVVSMNREAELLYNCRLEEVKGINLEEKIKIDFPGSREEAEKQMLKTGNWKGEMILYPKDKPPVNILTSSAVIYDNEHKVIGLVVVVRDITERIKMEEQNRYNSVLVENISDAILSTDKDFRIKTWNKAAEDIYGYRAEEVINKPISEVLTGSTSEEQHIIALSKLHENDYLKDEYEFNTKNGGNITVLTSVNVLRNNTGDIKGYVAVHRNITERRKAEERINYLASLVEQTSDAIFSIDNDSRIITWNKGAEHMYGYLREEVIGQNARKITHTAYTPEEFKIIDKAIEKKGTWSGDGMHLHRNGELIYVYSSITAIKKNDDTITGYVLVVRNITERRRLEEQLRNFNKELEKQVIEKTSEIKEIFDRVNDGFIAFDRDWKFTYVNKKAGEIYRIEPSSMVGKNVWELLPQSIGNPFYDACHLAMKEQRYFYIENYSEIFDYWYESHIYPSPNGLSVYFRDITERKKAQELLNTSEETRRLIISSAMDAIVCTDQFGSITVWNTNAEKIFGWNEKEIMGLNLADTIIPDRYRAAHKKGMEHYHHTGEGPVLNKILEIYALNRNGDEFPVEITIIPIQQKGTNFFCAFIRDITERRKTESAILREKLFSEKILDSLPGIFYFLDHTGKFLRWNKQLEIISGYNAEEIGNMRPEDFFDEREKRFIPVRMTDAFARGYNASEGRLLTKDGRLIPFYFTGSFIEYENKPCLIGNAIDITERKKAEKKLVEERRLLRTLIDNLPDYIYVKDSYFRHLINNKAHITLVGANNEEETLGKTVYDYFDNWLATQYIEDDKKVFETRKPIINREEIVVTSTGEQRWLLTTKVPVLDRNHQMSLLVGISRDITDRKNAEKEIRESNERFEMIARTTNDAVWEWDMNSNRTWANEMHQNLYGLLPTDPPPSSDEWKNRIHPDERETVTRDLESTLASDKNTWISEYRFLKEKNNYISIYDRTYIVRDNQGKPMRMLGSMMDITARKIAEETLRANEEKYRLLFSNSPLPMWVFEISTLKFLDVNEAALRHYGYSRNELMQMTVKDIRPTEELERLLKYFEGYQRGNVNSGNWKHLKKDGTIIEVEINSHDINYNGKAARLVLANDITDKVKAQRLIIETSEQLRQLSARLQDIREEERMHMAHEIHDELGQRLTVLKMDISWLSRKLKIEDETVKEKLKTTLVLLDGTIKIVRKIATDLRPGILDDLGLIPALEWQSKEFEERSGIKVNFKSNISEIALKTPVATGLFRIFQESLTNVGRHSKATTVESELVLQNDSLIMSIYDDGKGFDTSVLGSTKTLGIMGMKERTMMIAGEYTITSSPGKGTKVIVRVPMKNT